MIPDTNAADIRKGFNYQDLVALYVFLTYITDLKVLNNEGDEDIDILFKDGTYRYYQAKETKNVDKSLSKKELSEALRTLFNDIERVDDKTLISEIGVVTNCNYPFTKKDSNFIVPYMKKDHSTLSNVAIDRINGLIEELKVKDKNYKTVDFLYDKLTVTKLAYQGIDDDSRLERLEKPINRFLSKAKIENGRYSRLLKEWTFLFYRSSENKKYTITTENFVERTEIAIMDDPNLDDFFRTFHIRTGNKAYIMNNYSRYLKKLIRHFNIMSAIQKDFNSYKLKNQNLYEDEIEKKFVNEEYEKIANMMGFENDESEKDIAKLIIWLRIIHDSYFYNIERAAKIEN